MIGPVLLSLAMLCAAGGSGLEAQEFDDEAVADLSETDLSTEAEAILAEPEFWRVRQYLNRETAPAPSGETEAETEDDGKVEAAPEPSAPTRTRSAPDVGSAVGGAVASSLGFMFQAVAWSVIAVVVVLICVLAVRALISGRQEPDAPPINRSSAQTIDTPTRPPGEIDADAYLAQARRLAAEGQYREAVGQLLLGGMSRMERSGLIRFRVGLTYRDYLRAAGKEPDLRTAFRSLVRIYEPLRFGRRTPLPEHFTESLTAYEAGIASR